MRYDDLTSTERETLEVLLRSPALWCLQIVAGELGFDAAVTACQRRLVPEDFRKRLLKGGYVAEYDLPPYSGARLILAGVRIAVLRYENQKAPMQSMARRAGLSMEEGRRALQMVQRISGRKSITGRRVGEIEDNERREARAYGG